MRIGRRVLTVFAAGLLACAAPPDPTKEIPSFLLKFPGKGFAYPIGESEYVTEKNDVWDAWYNAQDFGENRHLGEDWNRTTGGDSDCGEPVYSAGDGTIVFARDGGPGWGNVVMIEHSASDGTRIRTLYAHLQSIAKITGEVQRREQVGTIGNANGRYKCHLHFEMRWNESSHWDDVGPGYSDSLHGWIDPSEFIEKTR